MKTIIEKYKGKLDWIQLSANPALTPAFIEENIEKLTQNDNWDDLSQNPSLTPALIEKYKNKLNWRMLALNPAIFSYEQGIVNHSGGV